MTNVHTNLVLSTRNTFEEVKVPKSRGALGTGFTYAPVCRAGGKPSTWFPLGTRRADHIFLNSFSFFSAQRDPEIIFYALEYFLEIFRENSTISLFFHDFW